MEGVKVNNKKLIIIFVDFKNAFGSLNQETMINVLKAYGFPSNFLNAMKLSDQNTNANMNQKSATH